MGDRRYGPHLAHIVTHGAPAVSDLSDEQVVQALAALAGSSDSNAPYLANVLASEAMNRFGRARAAIAALGEGLIAIDLDGACTLANPEAERLLGWTSGELRGTELAALVHAEGSDQECVVRRALRTGDASRSARESLTRRDGSILECDVTVTPVLRENERVGAVVLLRPTLADARVRAP